MFTQPQIDATLKDQPDSVLASMAQNPVPPTTIASIMGEQARRARMRVPGLAADPSNPNPMGAKPIGFGAVQPGVAGLNSDNVAGLKEGGIIPSSGEDNDFKSWHAKIHGEVARRKKMAAGGIVKHFDGGGWTGGDALEGAVLKNILGGGAKGKGKRPLMTQEDARLPLPPGTGPDALAAQLTAPDPEADPMADFALAAQRQAESAAQLPGGAPTEGSGLGVIDRMRMAASRAAGGNWQPDAEPAPAPAAATVVPKSAAPAAPAAPKAATAPAAAKGIAAVGKKGKGSSKAGTDVDALFDDAMYGDEPAAAPTKKGLADYISELKTATNSDAEIKETKDRIQKMRDKNDSRDSLQDAFLSGIGKLASSGGKGQNIWAGLGAGLDTGVQSYQANEKYKDAYGLKVDAEDMKRLSDQIASNKALGIAAVGGMRDDTNAEKAAQVAAASQARDASRERIQQMRNDGMLAALIAKSGAGSDKLEANMANYALTAEEKFFNMNKANPDYIGNSAKLTADARQYGMKAARDYFGKELPGAAAPVAGVQISNVRVK